jgi:hypothetical protein
MDIIKITGLEITEIKTDQSGTFIRFDNPSGEEGFILIPDINKHQHFRYGNVIDIEINIIEKEVSPQ